MGHQGVGIHEGGNPGQQRDSTTLDEGVGGLPQSSQDGYAHDGMVDRLSLSPGVVQQWAGLQSSVSTLAGGVYS